MVANLALIPTNLHFPIADGRGIKVLNMARRVYTFLQTFFTVVLIFLSRATTAHLF